MAELRQRTSGRPETKNSSIVSQSDASPAKSDTPPHASNTVDLDRFSAPEGSRPALFYLPLNTAFNLLALSHILAAIYAPVQDCDEVFNYWEPLHYLNHGYGFQTWEYSPEYAIRSWFYIGIHAIPAKLVSLFDQPKSFEFFFLRSVLGLVAAATETRLYAVISHSLNPMVGIVYLLIIAFSPGVFSASVAFLPSSFAMYTNTLALAAFLDRQGSKIVAGIVWFGIGAMVGWPFSGILILPFILEEGVVWLSSGRPFDTVRHFLHGTAWCLGILVGLSPFLGRD